MKKFIFVFLTWIPITVLSQKLIPAGVYAWPSANAGLIFQGEADALQNLEIVANTIPSGASGTMIRTISNEEQLLLVRSGHLTIHMNDSMFTIGKGSIAMILPGTQYAIQNDGSMPAQYYMMKYTSKATSDPERGKSAGGSFVRDWDELQYKPHSRGGVRPYFERPTTMSKRFEMHVTTLHAGLTSHDPHTHKAEEIVLILEGTTEMQIDKRTYEAKEGDVLFVTSNSLHGIRNAGNTQCSYFAFQWE